MIAHLREFFGNRRRARRYRRSVPFSVSLYDPKLSREQLERAPRVKGVTRDISTSGLGLIVPAVRIDDRYLTASDQILRLLLEYPGGTIEMHVIAVRYEQFAEDGAAATTGSYLIGVRIAQVSESDRARFAEDLQRLS